MKNVDNKRETLCNVILLRSWQKHRQFLFFRLYSVLMMIPLDWMYLAKVDDSHIVWMRCRIIRHVPSKYCVPSHTQFGICVDVVVVVIVVNENKKENIYR